MVGANQRQGHEIMHAKLMKLKTRFTTTLAALTIAGGTAAPPALNAEEKNTAFNPPIKSVVVYPDRALVTRDTRMRLKKGKHLLVFASARPSLDATSLRAFSDNRDIVVQGIGSRLERKVRTINPRIREIEKDIDVLRRRIQAKNFSMSRARGELGGINKYYQYGQASHLRLCQCFCVALRNRWHHMGYLMAQKYRP